jgi:hypothetical protein
VHLRQLGVIGVSTHLHGSRDWPPSPALAGDPLGNAARGRRPGRSALVHISGRALARSSRGAPPLGGDEAMKKGAAVPPGLAALFKTA